MDHMSMVKAWESAWSSRDVEEVAAICTEDICFRSSMVPHALRGLNQLRGYMEKLFDLYPQTAIEVCHARHVKGRRSLFVRWQAKVPDQVSATRLAEVDGVSLLTIRDGKIMREESYYDRLPIAVNALMSAREAGGC